MVVSGSMKSIITELVYQGLYENYGLGWTLSECKKWMGKSLGEKIVILYDEFENYIYSQDDKLVINIFRNISEMIDWNMIITWIDMETEARIEEMEG